MDHMTKDQLKQRAISETVEVLKQNQNETLNHDQIVMIGNKLGLKHSSTELTNLICDEDPDGTNEIEVEDFIKIIDYFLDNKREKFILTTSDETELATKIKDFHQKSKKLIDDDVKIDKNIYNKLCEESGLTKDDID